MTAYPLVMNHPHFVPAVEQRPSPSKPLLPGEEPCDAKAAIFPPVIVENEDQENQHRALGYLAAGEQIDDYVPIEYPKWVSPERLVQNATEEAIWQAEQDAAKGTTDTSTVNTTGRADHGEIDHEAIASDVPPAA